MNLKKLLKDEETPTSYFTDFLLNELNTKYFWYYKGTDTKGDCKPMYWLVFQVPQYIEEEALDRLKELTGESIP